MLDISLVDFTDPYDISGFVSLLCQTGVNLGMTMPYFKPTKESNEIRRLADNVSRKLAETMPVVPASDAFITVQAYDLAYRTAYRVPPEQSRLNKYVLQAFDAMIHGDKSVDEYAMYQAIAQALRRRDREYFDEPLIWLTTTEEHWYKEAKLGFVAAGLSDYDIINRVAILLRADLTAYEGNGQRSFKQDLSGRFRHYLDTHDVSDWRTIYAADRLYYASCPFLSGAERQKYATRLNEEKQNCPSINRFMGVALRLVPEV